jgi:uncharacterized coiled-coil DUF342 family protein
LQEEAAQAASVTHAEAVAELESRIAGLTETITQNNRSIDDLGAEQVNLTNHISDLESVLQATTAAQKRAEGQAGSLRSIVDQISTQAASNSGDALKNNELVELKERGEQLTAQVEASLVAQEELSEQVRQQAEIVQSMTTLLASLNLDGVAAGISMVRESVDSVSAVVRSTADVRERIEGRVDEQLAVFAQIADLTSALPEAHSDLDSELHEEFVELAPEDVVDGTSEDDVTEQDGDEIIELDDEDVVGPKANGEEEIQLTADDYEELGDDLPPPPPPSPDDGAIENEQ